MKKNLVNFASVLSLTMALVSCSQTSSSGNTSTGNPLVSLTVTGSGSAATVHYRSKGLIEELLFSKAWALPPASLFDSNLTAITLNEFWLGIKNLEFKSTETATSGETSDIQLVGPFAIDLLASSPSPIGNLNAPAEGIRRFRARLDKVDSVPAGAPSQLSNNSVVLKGVISGHQFTVVLANGIDYEISGPKLVSLTSGSRLLVSFQTANLFKKINLSAISSDVTIDSSHKLPATNPCPTINASASDLYTCFESGLKTEANAGVDSSGNDELDGSEDSIK